MENDDKIYFKEGSVHKVLAHSYLLYLFFLLAGVSLDVFFKFEIFSNSVFSFFGIFFLIFGTFLIFWAQNTSRNLKTETINKDTFTRGPYYYTRSPTHLGLASVILGFGIITNAFFVVFFALISFIISKFTFLKKEEKILALKYGDPYLEYKKLVRF